MAPRRAFAPLAALVALTAGLALAPPASADNTFINYQASIDVQMDLRIESTFESIQKCTPGEKTSGSYRFDFESGGKNFPKPVKFALINGFGGTFAGSLGRSGGAREIGTNGGWEFSLDDCNDNTDIQLPPEIGSPQCKTLTGRVEAYLVVGTDNSDLEELAPLARDGYLAFYRKGGGAQNLSCLRYFQKFGTEPAEIFAFTTALTAPGINVPPPYFAGFTVKLKNISATLAKLNTTKKTAEVTRKFSVNGPCYAYGAKSEISDGHIGATYGSPRYETCSVKGDGMVIIRRKSKFVRLKTPGKQVIPAMPAVPPTVDF